VKEVWKVTLVLTRDPSREGEPDKWDWQAMIDDDKAKCIEAVKTGEEDNDE
jgi:hypothetical protein